MAQKSKFMKLVYLLLFKQSDYPAASFVDNRTNGKYRVKVVFPENEFTNELKEKLEKLPHVLEVKHTDPGDFETRIYWPRYDGISITLDCRPTKAI